MIATKIGFARLYMYAGLSWHRLLTLTPQLLLLWSSVSRTVAFKVEGKKRAQFGWVAGERVPSFAKSTESEAAAGAQQ